MIFRRLANILPILAVLGSVTALGIGTSFAKQLFPQVGSLGTTALRVGFSALLLLALWRPWRWPLSRADAMSVLRYGMALGFMNMLGGFKTEVQHLPSSKVRRCTASPKTTASSSPKSA